MFSETGNAPAKVIKEFRKNWSGEKLQRVINDFGNKDIQAQNIVKMAEVLINKDNFDKDDKDANDG